jgi:TolA-binding protein
MRYSPLFYCGFLFLLPFLEGCSNITTLRIAELKQVQAHVDSLKTELADLQERILSEQQKQSDILRQIRADQQVRFTEIEQSVNALAGNVSDSQDKLSKIDEKTFEIKKRWEEKARMDSLTEVSKRVEIEKTFELCQTDFSAGRYELALTEFQTFLTKYPDVLQVEDALFGSAECYYMTTKYSEAEKGYKEYLNRYKEGKKSCIALFKLGSVYEKMNKDKAKTLVWTKLLSQCPNTQEADAVKARL